MKRWSRCVLVVILLLGPSYSLGLAEKGNDVWEELVDRANKLYREAEEEREKGDLLTAFRLLSSAAFMFPDDQRIKVRLDSLMMELEHQLEQAQSCSQDTLVAQLKEAQKELVEMKKRLVEEKESWRQYYEERLQELERVYEDKVKTIEEKAQFDLEKKDQMYRELLASKQEEYRARLEEIKKQLRDSLMELEKELKEKERQIAEKDAKIKRILNSYSLLEKKLEDKYQNTIASLQDKFKAAELERRRLAERLSVLSKELEERGRRIKELLNKYDAISKDYRKLKQDMTVELSNKDKAYQDCQALLKDREAKMRTMEAKIKAASLEKDNMRTKLEIAEGKAQERERMLEDLRKRLEERDIIIRNLKDKIANLQRKAVARISTTRPVEKQAGDKKEADKAIASPEMSKTTPAQGQGEGDLFQEAMKAIDREDFALAKQLLERLLQEDPDNTVAKYMLESIKVIVED